MKRCLVLGLMVWLGSTIYGQSCRVPKSYNFRCEADYAEHASEVKECMHYLASKPMHQERVFRSSALIYVLSWLEGSPQVVVKTYSEFLVFEEECPDLVAEFVYMLALNMISLGRPSDAEVHLRSLQSLIDLHKKSEGPVCPSLDKLAAMSASEMETWVSVQYRLAVGEH